MTPTRLRAAGDTHTGLQRGNNEDRFFFDDRHGLFCVIDGVGGHHAGERAAEIAAETLRARLASPDGAARLHQALVAANEAIFRAASGDSALHGMACVATVAIVNGERLRFGHVGDTRLFKIRDGAITKLTHDHSPVGELEDAGELTETEAMRHPRRNEIYRDLGSQARAMDEKDFVEIGDAPFERDAALVLCSDGLSDLVSSGSVRRIVESHAGAPALAVQELINAANDAGGKDNVTAVVVEGEAFADAVAARGRGGARPRGTTAQPPKVPPAMSAAAPATARKPRGIVRAALALVLGLVIGAAIVVGAQLAGWDVAQWIRARMAAPAGPHTWRVGLDAAADFPSIGEALTRAAAGDTVMIGPGEYREALRLPEGVTLIGTRASVLRPPIGAPPEWTAITVQGVTHGRVVGLLVAPSPGQTIATGLVVEDASIEIDDIEISGASIAGAEFRAGARAILRRSFVHDNPGTGVLVRAGAEPRLEFNVILHNGTRPGAAAPGVLVDAGARPLLVANGIGANGGPAVAGWPPAELADLARRNALSPTPGPPPAPQTPPRRRAPPRNRTP